MDLNNWEKEYEKWNTYQNLDSLLKEDLERMQEDKGKLEEAFYQELTFGTGGMRGILGPGINRMNIYTVRKAVNGLANYLKKNHIDYKSKGVVIAYDPRHMSPEFALEAAKVLGKYGIRSYVFSSLRPTPLLSFAVRYLKTAAGIMITASHNPPEYNGFKVYNEDGGQITLDEANDIISEVNQSEDGLAIPIMEQHELEESQLLSWVDSEVDAAYLAELSDMSKLNQAERNEPKNLKIVFTPLHGTAYDLVMKGLEQLNFPNVQVVKEQVKPDPEFSTVKSPNPEEPQAFKLAIEQGKSYDADILLATDPDADRLGLAVKEEAGEYTLLSGNQLGVLLLDYILSHSNPEDLKKGRMLKTIVTTELGKAIARSYGVETVDTLTGFKFIGEKIRQYDTTGETFLFGFEESYGYLINDFARDKDAIQATMVACEMAHYWKNKNKTLIDALNILYEKHGYYLEGISPLTLEGIKGSAKIGEIMSHFRTNSFYEIAGLKVAMKEDYLSSERTVIGNQETVEPIHLPKENVIKFILDEDNWVCLRPSGTEPKIKCYYGVRGESLEGSRRILESLQRTMEEWIDEIVVEN